MVVALPKGRIAKEVLGLFSQIFGDEFQFSGRKLILEKQGFKFLNVRNWDVAVYVEQGVADVGIVGLDVLEELKSRVFRLWDLGLGQCRVSVAGQVGEEVEQRFREKGKLKIATKLTHLARSYFEEKGIPVEVLKLNGSIELAPLVGLSDFIVDIVETGQTLQENGLEEKDVILYSSAHFIANPNSFWKKRGEIVHLLHQLKEALPTERRAVISQ
jgi:ATP phosphoribosyltransferase